MKKLLKPLQSILLFPGRLVLAWIACHIMALFGTFAFAAYPIAALFFPKRSICLGCRITEDGHVCSLCNETVHKHEGRSPKNFRSVFLNSLIILLITVLSITVVYIENMIIDNSGVLRSGKTVTFKIPDKSQYRTNEIFPMKIEVLDINTPINVVQADITFDPEILEVIDVATNSSFAPIIVQKDINNNLGYVRLTGGIPSPGYAQKTGVLGTIYFKSKSAGLASVSFLPTSLVLADDGRGTNVLKSFPTSSYVVKPELIPEEEAISQIEFYKQGVLGANTEEIDEDMYCKVDLSAGNLQEVLGTSDPILDEPTLEEVSNSDVGKNLIFTFIVNIVDIIDSFIVNFYSQIVNSII